MSDTYSQLLKISKDAESAHNVIANISSDRGEYMAALAVPKLAKQLGDDHGPEVARAFAESYSDLRLRMGLVSLEPPKPVASTLVEKRDIPMAFETSDQVAIKIGGSVFVAILAAALVIAICKRIAAPSHGTSR